MTIKKSAGGGNDLKKIRPNDLSLDDELDEIYDIANKSGTKYANKD